MKLFAKWETVVLFAMSFKQAMMQDNFIRDCNDPLVAAHAGKYTERDSFCYHACGLLRDSFAASAGGPYMALPDTSTCDGTGNCICNFPCSTPTSPIPGPVDSNICPPFASDPADPDLTALPRCMTTCESQCIGGTGIICGEIRLPPNQWAKICTCYCPAQPCESDIVIPDVIPFPIPTIPPETFMTQVISIVLKKVLLKKLFTKLLAKKYFKLCIILLKVCLLYLFKCVLIFFYILFFCYFVNWDIRNSIGKVSDLGDFINSTFDDIY